MPRYASSSSFPELIYNRHHFNTHKFTKLLLHVVFLRGILCVVFLRSVFRVLCVLRVVLLHIVVLLRVIVIVVIVIAISPPFFVGLPISPPVVSLVPAIIPVPIRIVVVIVFVVVIVIVVVIVVIIYILFLRLRSTHYIVSNIFIHTSMNDHIARHHF